jgi:hypothetical protein
MTAWVALTWKHVCGMMETYIDVELCDILLCEKSLGMFMCIFMRMSVFRELYPKCYVSL